MTTETARTVEMPCIRWVVNESGIHPQKGTWTLTPISLQTLRPDIQALLSCPHCAAVLPFHQIASDEVDRKAQTGTLIRRDLQCKCGFLFTAKLMEWDKKRLYCVVYEVLDSRKVPRMKKEYMHAETRKQALWFFSQSHLDHPYHLIDAAPVFGYFVEDKNGEKLKVD